MFETRIRANNVMCSDENGEVALRNIIIVVLSDEPFSEEERVIVRGIALGYIDVRRQFFINTFTQDYPETFNKIRNLMFFIS